MSGLVGHSRRHVLSCRGSFNFNLWPEPNPPYFFLLLFSKSIVIYQRFCWKWNFFNWLSKLCPPNWRGGGGHTAFGVDPNGISVGVRVASCLHSICWTNWWILTKLAQTHDWEGGKSDQILVTFTSFSRSHQHFEFFSNFDPKKLVCTLSLEPNDGFWPNFIYCNAGMV